MTNQLNQSIMSEDSSRTSGRDAQRNNILAAKLVSETVRTTLGPKGMDKMLVDSLNDVIVTNDGVTILTEMQIEHPAAKMVVEIAKTQEAEVGDGTTTAVVIAGELLKNAEKLLDDNIHPSVITKGYTLATNKAVEFAKEIASKISIKDSKVLANIVATAITGKGPEDKKDMLAKLIIKAVKLINEDGMFDRSNIKVLKVVGGGVEESSLIEGIVIDKEKLHESMPTSVKDAKIALINAPLEIRETEIDAKIQITDPQQMQAFIDQEDQMLRTMVAKIKATGTNVIFCQKGVDDLASHYFAKEGVLVLRRVKKSDMDSLASATGAKVVSSIEDLSSKELGFSKVVSSKKVGEDDMIFIEECKNPKTVTMIVKGGTEHIVDEVKRACLDAIGDVQVALKDGMVVTGGASTEVEIARRLRAYSASLPGREQLAVNAFADSLEVIPKTLSENAGFDPIDILSALKNAHNDAKLHHGVDAYTGKIVDMKNKGVIEPLRTKTQALKSAGDVAVMILRIDDVILANNLNKQAPSQGMPPMPQQGGYPGYGM